MSDKPKLKNLKVENASPQQLRETLEEYVQHLLDHDPDKLEFALMVTGHGEADGGTHVCSMIGGPPQTLAIVIMELMKRSPEFAIFFLMNMIQHMGINMEIVEMSKFDLDATSDPDLNATGSPDVEAQVKDLISRLQSGTPPSGSTH